MLRSPVVPALLLVSGCAVAQSFEAASVKPVQLADLRGRYRPIEGGPGSKTPTRIDGHTTLMWMVTHAFGVKAQEVRGPSGLDMEFFEITATLAPGVTKEQEKSMWQNLLKERFHLEAHRETRELPAFALMVGRNGPKLKESDPAVEAADKDAAAALAGQPRPKVSMGSDGFPEIPADAKLPGSFTLSLSSGQFLRVKMFCRHQTMAELANGISNYAGRPVEDQTGLKGKYDFTLAFETDPSQPITPSDGSPADPSESGAGLFTAVREQLGLRLETKKSAIELLIIDRIEKVPTEND